MIIVPKDNDEMSCSMRDPVIGDPSLELFSVHTGLLIMITRPCNIVILWL